MITKEHIEQAKRDTIQIFDDLLANYKKYAFIKDAYWENAKIVVEFETNVDIDIKYWFGDKIHEVEDYVDKIDQTKGIYRIGVNQFDKDWNVQLIGEVESESVNVGAYRVPEQPEPVKDFWHGLWDSWNYSGDFNTVKTKGISDAIGLDGNVFVSLSHRWKGKTRDQWQSILRGFVSVIEQLDPERTIILLQDEPLSSHHGFTIEDVQFLYDTAKELMPAYQFGFTFTRGAVNNKELPESDWMMLTAYPFFRSNYPDIQIHGKAQFDQWFDDHISKARAKFDGDIYVIGQGFYNPDSASDRRRKWRQPPLEAPAWYAEAVQRNNLKGIIWWVYSIDRDDTVGLEDMPDYFKEVMKLNQLY